MTLPGIDVSEWDEWDVRDMLAVVERSCAEGDIADAVDLLGFLLELPQVRGNDELFRETKKRLVAMQRPTPAPSNPAV